MSFEDDVKYIASTPVGRRFLWHLFDTGHLFSCAFGRTNDITNFNCGRQAFAQDIVSILNAVDPALFNAVLLEPTIKEKQNENQSTYDPLTGRNTTDDTTGTDASDSASDSAE